LAARINLGDEEEEKRGRGRKEKVREREGKVPRTYPSFLS